jgi:histidinol-phosphate/aromatic aminotransferase/cobyric acid decarboxylase-like protein
MLDEMISNIGRLVIDYPSGLEINNKLVAKYYNLSNAHIVVGNGAAELIKIVMEKDLNKKYGIIAPTFEEYSNRLLKEQIIKYYAKSPDFAYTARDIQKFFDKNKIDVIVLINPDNPTGHYISKQDVLGLAKWAKKQDIQLIVDESFGDFVDIEEASIIDHDIIADYSNLIVIKSISKSFGVPGIRLGIMCTSNVDLINYVIKKVSIWNINSFGEFFLQIIEKYKKDYISALQKFYKVRKKYLNDLSTIDKLRVIPSQANYFICEILNGKSALDVAISLLEKNIFIKVLDEKDGIEGNYIRIAVKSPEENAIMIRELTHIFGGIN